MKSVDKHRAQLRDAKRKAALEHREAVAKDLKALHRHGGSKPTGLASGSASLGCLPNQTSIPWRLWWLSATGDTGHRRMHQGESLGFL